ncbi:hypothetical protein EDC04DRAFT_298535 [Pisolithus marmoratus]|nr:hypothetical protein EDC04DRAFT_298535 [Pisolithus marmoratus]
MVHPSFHSNTFTAILTVLLAAASITPVQADPTPTSPGPGDVFIEGQSCSVAWLVDTTGVWTTTNIYLMTGDNYNMVRLATVGTVDGTDPTKTTYSYPCPQVSPHAAIYFYEFSSPASANLTWTTRFTVTDSISNIVPAPQSTQPGGPNIPWGVGTIVGTSASGSGSISSPVLPSALSAVTSICPPTASMTDSRVSPIVTTPTPIPSTNCTTTSPGSFSPPAVPSVLSTVTSLPPPTVSMTDSCVSSFVTIVTSSMAIFSTTVSMTDSKVSSAHTIGTTSTPLPSTTSMTTSNGANIDVPPGLLWRAVFSIGVPIFGFAVMF